MSAIIDWLLTAEEPWVVYNTLLDLAGAGPDSAAVKAGYRAMQNHPRVAALIEALDAWPPDKPLSKAYDPKDSIWKLNTLADFGLRRVFTRCWNGCTANKAQMKSGPPKASTSRGVTLTSARRNSRRRGLHF